MQFFTAILGDDRGVLSIVFSLGASFLAGLTIGLFELNAHTLEKQQVLRSADIAVAASHLTYQQTNNEALAHETAARFYFANRAQLNPLYNVPDTKVAFNQ